ncbi:hypothetical protein SMICM17S_00380 [Streptomyces microflavus]
MGVPEVWWAGACWSGSRRLTRRWPSPSGAAGSVTRTRAGREPEGRFAEPQQGAGRGADGLVADLRTVQGGAVRRAEVGDGPGRPRRPYRAVRPGHVRVVQRDIGLGGAADPDPAAVQQMDTARVRPGDHVQLRRDGVVRRLVLTGDLEREHRAVHQRRFAEGDALGVQPLRPAKSTTAPPPWEPSGPETACARPEATAASAVPAGAVTSTSQARAGVWPLRGARTVSRICIAVGGTFCAGCPAGETPCDSPHPARTGRPYRSSRTRAPDPSDPCLEASSHLPLTTRPAVTFK